MQSLWSTPMRNNNNRLYESGDVLLSDFITVVDTGGIHLRIDCASIDPGNSIVVDYAMLNSGVETGSGGGVYDAPGKHEIVFSRSDFDDATTIRGTIQTVGRARYSIDILSSANGEDILEWL